MNISNIPPKFTASSILKNSSSKEIQDNKQQTDIKDTVERSVSEKFDFLKISPKKKKKMKTGAYIGAAAGAVTGGIVAYNASWNKIKATNTIQSITLDWQEPDIKPQELGKIPADYYVPTGSSWGSRKTHTVSQDGYAYQLETQPVIVENPVIGADGKPQMHNVQKTYTDYGEPVVQWKSQDIRNKSMSTYTSRVDEDYHYYKVDAGKDENGNTKYEEVKSVDGYWHRFEPDIVTTKIGSYNTPKVYFETGVNLGLNTFLGILGGAGLGALVGAASGAVVSSVMDHK